MMARTLFVTWRTFNGPFSAVWTATIARKDAFFSIFHNLRKYAAESEKTCRPLHQFSNFRQNFQIFTLQNFTPVRYFSAQISWIFSGISQDARELLKVSVFCAFFRNFVESWAKKVQTFEDPTKKLRSGLCGAPELTGLLKSESRLSQTVRILYGIVH